MSIITITIDDQGNAAFSELPPGVFHSRFAAPPDAQIKDVISINSPAVYAIQIVAPDGTLADASATPPVELASSSPSQVVFTIDATELPMLQDYGTASCDVSIGDLTFQYSLGVIVNPVSLSIPVGVNPDGTIWVNQDNMPIGVHFNSTQHWFTVWGAGGYTFAFALPSNQGTTFAGVEFEVPPPSMITYAESANGLTVWIYNNYLETNPISLPIPFNLLLNDTSNSQRKVDPTIINNPINQGGDGGVWLERCERADAGAQREVLAA